LFGHCCWFSIGLYTQIYIVELDKPIPKPWGRYNYRCITVPDGRLSISEEFTIEDWKGEVKGLMQECDDCVKRIKELERKVVNLDIECDYYRARIKELKL